MKVTDIMGSLDVVFEFDEGEGSNKGYSFVEKEVGKYDCYGGKSYVYEKIMVIIHVWLLSKIFNCGLNKGFFCSCFYHIFKVHFLL